MFDQDFSEIDVKGRGARGNILTKYDVLRIGLKSHGGSTLGGRDVWFDNDVMRLNYENHGVYLGEFFNEDQILVILNNGEFYVTNFDINNHYEQNILRIEKYNSEKVWTAVLWDADNQGLPYIKRFTIDASLKHQNFLGDNPASTMILITDTPSPRLELTFKEPDTFRGPQEMDVEEFIAVKGFKAKGKRLTTWALDQVTEIRNELETPEEPDSMETPEVPESPETPESPESPDIPESPAPEPQPEPEPESKPEPEPEPEPEDPEPEPEPISDEEYHKTNPPHDDSPIQLELF